MRLPHDLNIFDVCRPSSSYIGPDGRGSVSLDLRNWDFLGIGQIVVLALMGKHFQARGHSVDVIDGAVSAYLQRMNFFTYLHIPHAESFQRHASQNKFMELSTIEPDDNTNTLPSQLRNIFGKTTHVDRSLLGALDYSFGEIIDNVINHSETKERGIVAAQYYPQKGYVEFCVADLGIGIPRSLRKSSQYAMCTDAKLLIKAFDHGVGENTNGYYTGKGYGAGFGLTFSKRLVEASSGYLWVVSHDTAAHLDLRGFHSLQDCWFPGTAICLRIPSDVVIKESDVLDDGTNLPYDSELLDGFDDDILW